MKKIVLSLMTVFIVGCTSTQKIEEGSNLPKISIVSTSNIGGKLESGIGYSRLLTVIKKEESKYGKDRTFYLDAGGNFLASGDVAQGKLRKVLTSSKLKATTLASGDFEQGLKVLEETKETGNFHILASNIKYANGQNFLSQYLIEEVQGKKIGIIGIVSQNAFNDLNEVDKMNLKYVDPFIALPPLVQGLKNHGVDFIIALSSIGNQDEKLGIDRLVSKNPEINLVIDGGIQNLYKKKKTTLIGEAKEMNSIGLSKVILGEKGTSLITYEKIESQNLIVEEEIKEEVTEENKIEEANLESDTSQINSELPQEELLPEEKTIDLEGNPGFNNEGLLVRKYKIEKDSGLENLINLLKN